MNKKFLISNNQMNYDFSEINKINKPLKHFKLKLKI